MKHSPPPAQIALHAFTAASRLVKAPACSRNTVPLAVVACSTLGARLPKAWGKRLRRSDQARSIAAWLRSAASCSRKVAAPAAGATWAATGAWATSCWGG